MAKKPQPRKVDGRKSKPADSMRPGAHHKRLEAVQWCLDLHRSAARAFRRYCQVEGIALPVSGQCLVVVGEQIAKVDAVLGDSSASDFPALRAWNDSDAYAKWVAAEEAKAAADAKEAAAEQAKAE